MTEKVKQSLKESSAESIDKDFNEYRNILINALSEKGRTTCLVGNWTYFLACQNLEKGNYLKRNGGYKDRSGEHDCFKLTPKGRYWAKKLKAEEELKKSNVKKHVDEKLVREYDELSSRIRKP